jgi:hypothetical protein
MQVKRIYGALNVEFEGQNCVSFTIGDRKCDKCLDGKCNGCEEYGKPWMEYYEFIKYNVNRQEDEKVTYQKDKTEAIKMLIKMLQTYLDATKEEARDELCIDTEKLYSNKAVKKGPTYRRHSSPDLMRRV